MYTILENISRQTTVHGLNIIGLPKLHFLERILWVGLVALATAGAVAIAYSNWMRYQAAPTVVSIQKDFRNWENPFPAVTGCFNKKYDEKKAAKFIFRQWGVAENSSKFEYYMDFVKTVTNVSYSSLEDFRKYRDDQTLNRVDLKQLAVQVHPQLSGTLVTFDTKNKHNWTLVMTEMGICFSVNSKFAHIFAIREKIDHNQSEVEQILRCHYLNGLCYARYDSDPTLPLKYYIHSYLDIVHASIGTPLMVGESEELEINYRMQETDSSNALRDLTPVQRKCRFDDEPIIDDIPSYSISICYTICRYKLAIKYCGCRPFFYHILRGKVCDINGLLCLATYAQNFSSPIQLGCQCAQPCDLIIYFPQVPKSTKWEYGYFDQRITFRWGLLPPTTKFHRDILFGFEDLVVSIGGTLALFLGVSFISLIEQIFLIVENTIKYFKQKKRTAQVKKVKIYPKYHK